MKSPERGEVWMVDLGMAAKVRPAMVLSVPSLEQDRAIVTIVPHTTSLRASRFEVGIVVPFLKPGAFDAQNLLTIPLVKLQRKLPQGQLEQLEACVKSWLGL